jgi:hypothetical protein
MPDGDIIILCRSVTGIHQFYSLKLTPIVKPQLLSQMLLTLTSTISPPGSDEASFAEMPADFSVIYANGYGVTQHCKKYLYTRYDWRSLDCDQLNAF